MTDQAATQTGAAPQTAPSSQASSAPPSIADRLKAHQSQSDAPSQEPSPDTDPEGKASPVDPNAKTKVEAKPAETTAVDDPQDDGQETEQTARPTSLAQLAETLGADIEDILGIDIPTKIDGKDGTARLRDLLKSYQLEGHLNQKSMAFADEKKAFELQTQRQMGEYQQKTQQLDAALQVGQRMLSAKFANVNWDELQASDPVAFNATVVDYQHQQQVLRHIAETIGQEKQQQQQQQAQQFATFKAEELKQLQMKIPEWNEPSKRSKDIEEMSGTAKESYGISPEEVMNVVDHRQLLVLRDACKWQQLQKAKPDTLKKVQAAPKLLKPGTTQSRAAQDQLASNQARDRLRSTGKVSDAATALKRLGFA